MNTLITIATIVLSATTTALLLPPVAQAQEDGQSLHETMAKAEGTLSDVTEFIGDVHFDEKDVQSVIELWPEFEALGEKVADSYDEDEDSEPDFQAILADPTYRSWVSKHHLDRENWLRRALRIQLLSAKEEFDANSMPSQERMNEQMKQLESMREQMGEEAYQQMVKTMEAASSMMNSMSESMDSLPPATEEEQALLDEYREQLKEVLEQ